MSGENKKTGTDNKIMSFQIAEEELQDPKLDRYVRESLIQEADKLEEELNKRPDLADVKAPEGMFQAIVEELKKRGEWEEEVDKAEENSAVSAQDRGLAEGMKTDEEALKALYAQLPEEDRKALALGREIAQKKEAKAEKRRGRRKIFKIAGVAAACLAIVFGVSMTSDANRRLVQRMWDGLMVDFGFRVNTNYVGEGESIRSKSTDEIAAIEAISEQLGIPSISLEYLPKGTKYEGYEITNDFVANLFYSYHDTLFYLTITNLAEEGSYYYKYDNKAVYRKTVKNFGGIEAEIWKVNLDIGEETYIAELEHEGWRYVLNGMLPLEEMEKIIKYFIIL